MKSASNEFNHLASKACIPTSVMLELTSQCNQSCSFCYKQQTSLVQELTTQEVLDVIRQLASMGSLFILLTGGECLLRRDIFQLVESVRQRHFKITLFTNGIDVDESIADWVALNGVDTVQISVHASTAALHDQLVRRPGAFEQTIKAVSLIRSRNINTFLACTITELNYLEMDNLRTLATELGVFIRFNPRIHAPQRFNASHEWRGPSNGLIEKIFRRNDMREAFLKERESIPKDAEKRLCSAGRTRIRIDEIGNVYPCEFLRMPVGNIREGGVQKVWRESEKLQWLRSLTFGQTRCVECKLLPYCAPCIGRHYEDTGDIFTPSPQVCWEASLRKRLMDERGLVPESLQQSSSPASADDVPACEIDS